MDASSSSSSSSTPSEVPAPTSVLIQFKSVSGDQTGPQLAVPSDISASQLEILVNELLKNQESTPYSFYLEEEEIVSDLIAAVAAKKLSTEEVLDVIYQPQAIFRVRPVTRCSASIEGHTEAVLSVHFSPDGTRLASGSGDATVRLWDVNTKTPEFTCKGHRKWVLCVAWSPDGKKLASGSMDNQVRMWNSLTGKLERVMNGHSQYVTSLAWEPQHKNGDSIYLASGSKDGTVKIWDTRFNRCVRTLSGHTMSVTCVKWGGEGLIFSASQDRQIIVHSAAEGKVVRILSGHAHWINYLSLSTDYSLRCGAYHPDTDGQKPKDAKEAQVWANNNWEKAKGGVDKHERLVSCSDDHCLILWDPYVSKQPIAKMIGHQHPVNFVLFSPDGRFIASASFDKSVRLWDGYTGKYLATFRNHVGAVYQVCWSADSRMLVSSSKDSTMKLWDVQTKKMVFDLPGHADEVFAVDWAPDGSGVASGSKDRFVKIWCP